MGKLIDWLWMPFSWKMLYYTMLFIIIISVLFSTIYLKKGFKIKTSRICLRLSFNRTALSARAGRTRSAHVHNWYRVICGCPLVSFMSALEVEIFQLFQRTGRVRFNLANQNLVFQKSVIKSAHTSVLLMDDTTISNDHVELSVRSVRSFNMVLLENSLKGWFLFIEKWGGCVENICKCMRAVIKISTDIGGQKRMQTHNPLSANVDLMHKVLKLPVPCFQYQICCVDLINHLPSNAGLHASHPTF